MEYIVDFKPIILEELDYDYLANIEDRILNKISVTNDEVKYFLDSLCYIARNKINDNMDNFDYKCDMFQTMFFHYFANLNCEFVPCMTLNTIVNDIVGHSFSVLKMVVEGKEKLYLIDPSYIQFFGKNRCQYENYLIDSKNNNYVLLTPDPGYFIKDSDMMTINYLLMHGFIELDENLARIYGDSFLNTKRGLKDISVLETISGKVYINAFLKGKEEIKINEDGLENLGLLLSSFKEASEEKKK